MNKLRKAFFQCFFAILICFCSNLKSFALTESVFFIENHKNNIYKANYIDFYGIKNNKFYIYIKNNKNFLISEVKPNKNSSRLSTLENSILNITYPNDPELKRLDRLELEVFGTTYENLNSNERISKLSNTIGLADEKPNVAQNFNKMQTQEFPMESEDSSVSYPQVDNLEHVVFQKAFSQEDIYKRISRLEDKVFNKKFENLSLSDRIDALKAKIVKTNDNIISDNEDYYSSGTMIPAYGRDDFITANPNANYALSEIENRILKASYPNETIDERLSRIENKIFKRNFSNDSEADRLQRLLAVSEANQGKSGFFTSDKWSRGLAGAMQIGGLILMILAIIL